MPFTTQLRYEQDLLVGMAEALGAAARGDAPPPDLPRFCLLLGQFTQLLRVHLLREDSILYPAPGTSPDWVTAAIEARRREEHGALDRHIAAFEQAWTPDEIRRAWPAFSADIADLLEMVRQCIEREGDELYPLFDAPEDVAA